MSYDKTLSKNGEGYSDPTAAAALTREINRVRGMQNRRTGEIFEDMIADSLKWYELRGQACIEKTPEPMKPLSKPNKKGQFLACYVKAGQPDFKGTMHGGRSLVFEAKHTETEKIDYSRLTGEQVEKLKTHHALGAAVFVLVGFGLQDFYRIPWEVWRDMKAIYGRKHMKRADCEPYRVPCVAGIIKMLEGIDMSRQGERETNE